MSTVGSNFNCCIALGKNLMYPKPDQQRGKTRNWLDRYHFVVSTLALGLKINFDQPIKLMEFQ